MPSQQIAVVGFAPHSGWAAMVVLSGDPASPQVLRRERIEIADPRLSGSKQPYHAVEKLPVKAAAKRLARYSETAGELAYRAVSRVVAELRDQKCTLVSAGILDSSGRQGPTLESILASHALIHTADGEHFRQALTEACDRCGIQVARVPVKQLLARASESFRRPADQLQAGVQALGRSVGPPWGSDQKSAALFAWMLLASAQRTR